MMTFAEIRKAIIAAAALIATGGPQLLVYGDLLPQWAAIAITIATILAGIIGVWAVPNKPLAAKVGQTIDSLQDLAPIIRQIVREEVRPTPVAAPQGTSPAITHASDLREQYVDPFIRAKL
ncbi:hypothetical protein [Rhodococcus pyridinivorans]|uniref:hypothetical protein n=1 Tax=Rhodococcus pyridinivorans TaxID=103816 RepID=UPI0011C36DFD